MTGLVPCPGDKGKGNCDSLVRPNHLCLGCRKIQERRKVRSAA